MLVMRALEGSIWLYASLRR